MSETSEITGVWILRSFHMQEIETHRRIEVFGPNPRGVIIIHPGGRMVALITPRDQIEPATEADKAAAFQKLVAYSGRYRFEPPDSFVTTVDVAWFQPWIGTAQARKYKLDGDTLEIISAPQRNTFSKGLVIGVVSWVREGSKADQGAGTATPG